MHTPASSVTDNNITPIPRVDQDLLLPVCSYTSSYPCTHASRYCIHTSQIWLSTSPNITCIQEVKLARQCEVASNGVIGQLYTASLRKQLYINW